jgi:hypothetical protein
MSDNYNDGKIECTPTQLRIHGYYFPYGTKDIPYGEIKGVQLFKLSALRGKARIWGTGNFKYWANLDVGRPKKELGLVVDIGKSIKPFITPDDANAVATLLRERAGLPPNDGAVGDAPFI